MGYTPAPPPPRSPGQSRESYRADLLRHRDLLERYQRRSFHVSGNVLQWVEVIALVVILAALAAGVWP